jgi:uncharacterized membrane protein YbhN (UPF0104 family)
MLLFARHTYLHGASPPTGLATLLVVVGLLLLVAGVLAIPKLRHRGPAAIRQSVDTVRSLTTSRRAPQLLAMSLAVTLTYGACLYFAPLAAGASPSVPHAPTEAAIAGVLIYRLMSLWLPMAPGIAAFRRLSKQEQLQHEATPDPTNLRRSPPGSRPTIAELAQH